MKRGECSFFLPPQATYEDESVVPVVGWAGGGSSTLAQQMSQWNVGEGARWELRPLSACVTSANGDNDLLLRRL